jgi:hypothetical protein
MSERQGCKTGRCLTSVTKHLEFFFLFFRKNNHPTVTKSFFEGTMLDEGDALFLFRATDLGADFRVQPTYFLHLFLIAEFYFRGYNVV